MNTERKKQTKKKNKQHLHTLNKCTFLKRPGAEIMIITTAFGI